MNFYVPYAGIDAKPLWDWAREELADIGLPTTRRRIRALVWHDDEDEEHYVMVGGDTPVDEDDLVLLILESSAHDDMVFVCTLDQLLDRALPYALTLDESWQVVDFDDGPCGWA